MSDSESLLDVAIEIRELIRLMAEPAIALRDEKRRASLSQLAGKSVAKQKTVMLMDGSKSQKDIHQAAKLDRGDLSKLVKALRLEDLLTPNEKPQLSIPLPANFFQAEAK